jgi:hypothetical protein
MSTLPFSSLTPTQQARVAEIFCDVLFGSNPEDYVYEVSATGQLAGQRTLLVAHEKKKGTSHSTTTTITSNGPLHLTRQAAAWLSRAVIETVPAQAVSVCAD